MQFVCLVNVNVADDTLAFSVEVSLKLYRSYLILQLHITQSVSHRI